MASTARIDELKKKFDENPRRYFAPLANEFRKSGDVQQAIVICEEFLPQQPGHMSGHIVYGQALFEAGRLADAQGVFETALGLDPENLIALRHLGDIARGQSDLPAARGWYARVLDADPRNEEIQALVAAIDVEAAPERFSPPPADAASHLESAPESAPVQGTSMEAPTAPLPETEFQAFADHAPKVTEPAAFHLDLADTNPYGVPAVPPPLPRAYTPAPVATEATPTVPLSVVPPVDVSFDSFALEGIESAPETSSLMPDQSARAEGLESVEFSPPAESVAEAAGLDASLESGVPSFAPPAQQVNTLAGLQDSAGSTQDEQSPQDSTDAATFAPLDIEGGLLSPSSEAESFDIPRELTASVIAAEADLIDAGESPPPDDLTDPAMDAADETVVNQPPFVTETMAELYVAQGYRDEAFAVYQQLLDADPSNERLQQRLEQLTPLPVEEDSSPNVRAFFAGIAARRPSLSAVAEAPPFYDDLPEPVPQSETPAAGVGAIAPAIERAAAMHTPSGSIDALFGNRAPGTSEDSAAAALAQAFSGSSDDAPDIVGHPARAASGELSLDSVFRDGPARPPRAAQTFSFDQFFSDGATAGSTPKTTGSQQAQRANEEASRASDEPAERSADDIEQFNTWLQGLKQR